MTSHRTRLGFGAVLLSLVMIDSSAGVNGTTNGSTGTATALAAALPAGTTLAISATMTRPRKKRLLFVDATLQVLTVAGAGETIRMYPRVNGTIGMDPDITTPANNAVIKVCTPTAGGDYPTCSVTGMWWLDVDSADAISPGSLLDQPIQVDLMIETPAGNVTSANYSIRAHLLKK